jgi:uracil-DNA glycosylase
MDRSVSDDRADQLEALSEEIHELEASPLYDYRQEKGYHPVIGEGAANAAIMFIGEAPGAQEARSGRPFVGNAGRVLDGLLALIGLDREDVYITNVLKDRPPENRDPRVDEIAIYGPFLLRQIEITRPRVIATLGRFAMDFLLAQYDLPQQGQNISDLHGKALDAQASYGKVIIMPLYHPAAAFYNEELKKVMEKDFQALGQYV